MNNSNILWGNTTDTLGEMKSVTLVERHFTQHSDLCNHLLAKVVIARGSGTHTVCLEGGTAVSNNNIIINHNKTITINVIMTLNSM